MRITNQFARVERLLQALALGSLLLLGILGNSARAADADGLDLTLHPTGVAWFEENWLVKDGKLPQFLTAYRNEIYALARRTPDYRGYIVWTTIPPTPGEALAPANFGIPRDKFISPHPSIYLNGTIRTERAINIGMLMGKTYNVKIVHHFQTWKAAADFQAAMAQIYASEHGGEALSEHLSKTVYPLVDNVWTAFYRVVQTGYSPAAYPPPGSAKPGDSGGLNLEPHAGPLNITEEGWDVRPGQLDAFVKAYEKDVYSALRQIKGYRGYTVVTVLPPTDNAPKPLVRLGSPEAFTIPYPGLLMTGDVRTNMSINAGALFQKVYNTKVYHMIDNWEAARTWLDEYKRIYAKDHGNGDPWPLLEKTLFSLVNNHWDYGYRTVEMSFTPK